VRAVAARQPRQQFLESRHDLKHWCVAKPAHAILLGDGFLWIEWEDAWADRYGGRCMVHWNRRGLHLIVDAERRYAAPAVAAAHLRRDVIGAWGSSPPLRRRHSWRAGIQAVLEFLAATASTRHHCIAQTGPARARVFATASAFEASCGE